MYGQSSPKQGSELAPLGTSWGQGIVHGFHNNVHLAFFIISRLGHHLTSHRAKNTLPATYGHSSLKEESELPHPQALVEDRA